jgi:hypothetical protein
MGAVLEMKQYITRLGFGLAMFGLSACGSLSEEGTGSQVAELAVGLVTGQSEEPEPAASSVTEEQILNNPGKFMRVNIRDLDRWDTMVPAATNGSRVTWVDSENNTITLENGIVAATRGLPRDLMGADVSQTWAAIRSGGGNTQRIHELLTDNDQISTQLLQCRIVSKGPSTVKRLSQTLESRRFEEICTGEGLQLTNIYWLNRAGGMLRSLQAISPDAGYLQIDVF